MILRLHFFSDYCSRYAVVIRLLTLHHYREMAFSVWLSGVGGFVYDDITWYMDAQ